MASGKGSGAKGAKKKSSRRGKARGTGPPQDTLSVAATDDAQEMQVNTDAAASPSAAPDRSASTSPAAEPKGSSSIPTGSSSSAKQAQMFTVGTFDEYDGEGDGDGDSDSSGGRRSSALRSRMRSSQRSPEHIANGRHVTAVTAVSNPRSANGPAAAARSSLHAGSRSDQSGDEGGASDSSASVQASQKGTGSRRQSAVASPKSKLQARQPLFTMGSHSEMSDMDYADGYDNTKVKGSPARNRVDNERADAIRAQLKTSGDLRAKNLPPNAKVNLRSA
ncbi:hypothetical protein LPJ56_003199, partial [Coemansia sp. RSA 2599]